MLQRLRFLERDFPLLHLYLTALRKLGFSGEIHLDPSTRLVNATDNSVYQVLPQAVLTPKVEKDIVNIFKTANQSAFRDLSFTARGGGTGTNGQSLNDSIIIDCSKYLNHILELNLEENWVKVQAGVVLDQLNHFLQAYGVFFAPSLSPSNRATLGGMVNTDASGKGSRVYGKTSEHVIDIRAVYADGSVHTSHAISGNELRQLKNQDNLLGAIYRQVDETVCRYKATIAQQFPKLKRFMTGYNLAHVYKEEDDNRFNLNAILTGSEGTLAVVTELKLKLRPIPHCKRLFVLQYADFYDALRDAEYLTNSQPHAIETIDSTVLDLAKTDASYPFIAHFLETKGQETRAINLVEFAGEEEGILDKKVSLVEKNWKTTSPIAFAFKLISSKDDIDNLWNLRKKCVGLLAKEPGWRKPVSGVEDTIVPPEKLVDYVTEFRAILDKAGLKYGMFGHIDVGCLHVRPAFNLTDPHDEALYHQISDQIAQLTKKYGGLMWGEHGKGFRSQYVPLFFGTTLYDELRKIKKAFDPYNQLNPGKIATPAGSEDTIVKVTAQKRSDFELDINPALKAQYKLAIYCNGNGACFNYNVLDTMCPSYKATRDRRQSPKGRAALLREWLRLQSIQKKPIDTPRWFNSLMKLFGQDDFSHEVQEAMHGCLACKACATQCPVNVDIPAMKSPFLAAYYSRYLHPIRDYLVAYSEKFAYFHANSNFKFTHSILHNPLVKFMLRKLGLVDLPVLSEPSLKKQCRAKHIPIMSLKAIKKLTEEQRQNAVILVQDWLTSCYQAELVIDYYVFLTRCGYNVYLLKSLENGKTWHVLGFIKKFKQIAEKTAARLSAIAKLGIPMIGIEPSLTLTYRQEYPAVINSPEFKVQLIEEWLSEQDLQQLETKIPATDIHFFPHCSEKAANPLSFKQWQTIFNKFGYRLQMVEVGCCGMAGNYGLEVEHQVTSRQLFKFGWQQALENKTCLATGFSCRSQAKRLAHYAMQHPISFLLQQ